MSLFNKSSRLESCLPLQPVGIVLGPFEDCRESTQKEPTRKHETSI